MTIDLFVTQPKKDGEKIRLVKIANKKYTFAIGGYVYSEKPDDWGDCSPTHALLFNQRTPATAIARGIIYRAPFERPDRDPSKPDKLPWGISFIVDGSYLTDEADLFRIVVYSAKKEVSRSDLTFKKPATTDIKKDPNYDRLREKIAKDSDLVSSLLESGKTWLDLILQFWTVGVSSPTMGSSVSTSFFPFGPFGPYDTTIVRVDLVQGEQVKYTDNNPYSSPLGYWSASFSGVQAGDYYLNAVGNSTTGISGPFTVG
jgi:hypothetical protein